MRDEEVPYFESVEEVSKYITKLVDQQHSYGTCVYAMSMAATAAFKYVAHKLGVTGFQASCADLDILRRTRGLEWGKILDYDKLLYPQYLHEDNFPTISGLMSDPEVRTELKKRAQAKLDQSANDEMRPHDAVLEHWRMLAAWEPTTVYAEETQSDD